MIYVAAALAATAAYFIGHLVGYTRGTDDMTEAFREAIADESPYSIEGQRKAGRERVN